MGWLVTDNFWDLFLNVKFTTQWKLLFHEALFNSWNTTGKLGTERDVFLVFCHLLSALLTQSYSGGGGVEMGLQLIYLAAEESFRFHWSTPTTANLIPHRRPWLTRLIICFLVKNSNIFSSRVNHHCRKEIMFTFKCIARQWFLEQFCWKLHLQDTFWFTIAGICYDQQRLI